MKISVYNKEGIEVEKLELSEAIFNVPVKENLVAEVAEMQRANSRQILAHVKERGEVRGGGRKPWRQKGTGRARHGSIRSPLWRGGGVTFGPRNSRVFNKKINKKVKEAVFRMILSDKAANDKLVVIDVIPASGKTKEMSQARKSLPGAGRKMMVALDKKDDAVIRALSNLPKTEIISVKSLNLLDLLKNEYLLVAKDAVKVIEKYYK